MATRVVNVRSLAPGWRNDPSHVYIGRGSKWGNPFRITPTRTREQSISMYNDYLHTRPDLMDALPELVGKVLVCYCKPLPCHGDTLARMANQLETETKDGVHR